MSLSIFHYLRSLKIYLGLKKYDLKKILPPFFIVSFLFCFSLFLKKFFIFSSTIPNSSLTPHTALSSVDCESTPGDSHSCYGWQLIAVMNYNRSSVALFDTHNEKRDPFKILRITDSNAEFQIKKIQSDGLWISPPETGVQYSQEQAFKTAKFWKIGQFFPISSKSEEHFKNKGAQNDDLKTNCLALHHVPFLQLVQLFEQCALHVYPIDALSFTKELLFTLPGMEFSNEENLKKEIFLLFRLSEYPNMLIPQLTLSSSFNRTTSSKQEYAQVVLQHLSLSEEWEHLKKELQSKLSLSAKIVCNLENNILDITDDREHLMNAFSWLAQRDRPCPQFYLNARIFFCCEETAHQFGLDLLNGLSAIAQSHPPLPPQATSTPSRRTRANNATSRSSCAIESASECTNGPLLWAMHLGRYALGQLLSQLEIEGKITMLSMPSIAVRNHQRALLQQTHQLTLNTLSKGKKKSDKEPEEIHFKFEVVPVALNSGKILVKIFLTLAAPSQKHANPEKESEKISHTLETDLIVELGEPIILGGLLEEKTSQIDNVPFLFHWLPLKIFHHHETDHHNNVLLLCFYIDPMINHRIPGTFSKECTMLRTSCREIESNESC